MGIKQKNWSYTILEGEHAGKTLWSGRYTCVAAFIFKYYLNKWWILINQRGEGTPDFHGYWNAPCGYLEGDETGEEGCARETYEETGLRINPDKFILHSVNTDPAKSNNGNVTLHYYAILSDTDNTKLEKNPEGGELNEVSAIGWLPLNKIDTLPFAFDHDILIEDLKDTLSLDEKIDCTK